MRSLPLASALILGLCGWPNPPVQAQTPPDEAQRLAALRAQVVTAVEAADKEMAGPKPEPEVRHLATAGWCHLALGDNPKKGEEYLRQVLAWQIMDKASPEFGNWPWKVNHPEINDANSIDFAASFLAPPLLRYGAQLSEDFKREAQDHLKAAIVAERRHQVPVAYGNIYLMKLSNLIMLGELTGDATAVEEGKADLRQWLAWTRLHGDNEYDSPTYAPVQLTGLEHVFLHAPDEATKALAKVGLDYLWSDLAANYFGPRDSLGGPHSRSYDFLYQKGTIQHHYYLEGLAPTLAGKDYLGGVWLNAICPGCYHPAASILALGRIPDRTVEQTFGAEAGRERYNRITPDYDIGSVSAYYGPQDEQIAVEFASRKTLPVTCAVFDTIDAPYGKQQFKDRSGHEKPKHIRDVSATVQAGSNLLALYDLSPDLGHGKYENVATNIIIPMQADAVYLDDVKIPPGQVGRSFEQSAGKGSFVFVHEGGTAAALRIFDATGVEGRAPEFALKYDGNEWGAGRLVVYHYKGKSTKFADGTTPLAGVFASVEKCDGEAAFEAFRQRMREVKIDSHNDGRQWAASVVSGDTKLESALDLAKHEIAYRRVAGQDVPAPRLTVNGRDLAAEILDPLPLAPPAPPVAQR